MCFNNWLTLLQAEIVHCISSLIVIEAKTLTNLELACSAILTVGELHGYGLVALA